MWLARAQPLPVLQAGGPLFSGTPEVREPSRVAVLGVSAPRQGSWEEASLCGAKPSGSRRSWGGVFPWLKSSPCHPEAKPQLCCWAAGTAQSRRGGGGLEVTQLAGAPTS